MSEILGALFKAIVGLLAISAVVAMLYSVLGQNKTQSFITDVTLLQGNIQALYTGQPAFTSLNNNVAVSGKLAPASLISGSNLINPWNGGTVTVAVNAGNASQFDITATAIPDDACAKVVVGMSNLVAMKVNSTSPTLPVDPGAAVTACSGANNSNSLTLTYAH